MSGCPYYKTELDQDCWPEYSAPGVVEGPDDCTHEQEQSSSCYKRLFADQRARADAAEAEVARLTDAANKWAAREQATRDKLERFIVENHRLRDQIRELAAWKADAERLAITLSSILDCPSTQCHIAEYHAGLARGFLASHEARLKADKEQAE